MLKINNKVKTHWKTSIGKICAVAVFYEILFYPLSHDTLKKFGISILKVDSTLLVEILGMLFGMGIGMAGIKSFEKKSNNDNDKI